MILAGHDPVLATLRAQLDVAAITSREYTGVGFFTGFAVPESAPRVSPPRFVISDVLGRMTAKDTQVGFLLFVRDGVLKMLEGFTYGTDEWPADAELIESYYSHTDDPRSAVRDMERLRA